MHIHNKNRHEDFFGLFNSVPIKKLWETSRKPLRWGESRMTFTLSGVADGLSTSQAACHKSSTLESDCFSLEASSWSTLFDKPQLRETLPTNRTEIYSWKTWADCLTPTSTCTVPAWEIVQCPTPCHYYWITCDSYWTAIRNIWNTLRDNISHSSICYGDMKLDVLCEVWLYHMT